MKSWLRGCILVSAGALLLAGCAHRAPNPSGPTDFAPDVTKNLAYLNQIQRSARLTGAQMWWADPPEKRLARPV